ncbi:ScbR family autoregulator-binding transcription factor [Brevibacterium sp. FAM 24630]|uniref:ScbR family autoregulator-binding transcription factor n=1 Tax=unclassified Brevibacterium TaxID=2614124 RepID=UPI003C79E1B8
MKETLLSAQPRGEATRARIIEGAGITFSDLGYSASTFERIANAADVKMGSVYFHFKTKFLLAQAVVEEQHKRALGIITGQDLPKSTATDTLIGASHRMAELLVADPIVRAGLRLSLEDISLTNPTLPFYEEWTDAAAAIVQEGIEQREFSSTLDAHEVASTLIGCFMGVQLLSNARSRRSDLPEHLTAMWNVVLSGLSPRISAESTERID